MARLEALPGPGGSDDIHYPNGPISLEIRGPVARLVLRRPEVLNALNSELLDQLNAHLDVIEASSVRVVILTGEGRAFCAGADLSSIQDDEGHVVPEEVAAFVLRISEAVTRLAHLRMPVIAAINGLAMAGGLELLLACDLAFAAEGVAIADAHANYGLLPGAGGAVRLPRVVGPTMAKYMIYTGRSWPAEELVGHGLINEVVPADELQNRVLAVADDLSAHSRLGLATMKRLIDDGLDQPLDTALRLEAHAHDAHSHSPDFAEGISAFRERRSPRFP